MQPSRWKELMAVLSTSKASFNVLYLKTSPSMQLHPGQNGKYWQVSEGGIACDSEKPAHGFYLELREPTKVCIKTEGGNYLVEKRNGGFNVGGTDEAEATRLIFSLLVCSSRLSQNFRFALCSGGNGDSFWTSCQRSVLTKSCTRSLPLVFNQYISFVQIVITALS